MSKRDEAIHAIAAQVAGIVTSDDDLQTFMAEVTDEARHLVEKKRLDTATARLKAHLEQKKKNL